MPEGQIAGSGYTVEQAARAAAETQRRFAEAHAQLRADGAIQFDLQGASPPPRTPEWLSAFGDWLVEALKPIGRFLGWLLSFMPDAPYARIFLWSIVALAAAGLAWIVYERVRHGVWQLPKLRRSRAAEADDDKAWTPSEVPARAWLNEADRLAEQGRFAEAVHHLLIRSIEDIGRRRPQLLRPALTSRDIARDGAIPAGPRTLFAGIAAVVERSLFGGRAVDGEDWTQCRNAYDDFVAGRSWMLPR